MRARSRRRHCCQSPRGTRYLRSSATIREGNAAWRRSPSSGNSRFLHGVCPAGVGVLGRISREDVIRHIERHVRDRSAESGRGRTRSLPSIRRWKLASLPNATVARLRQAGAVTIGKTNLDQFATGLVGILKRFPSDLNRRDSQRVKYEPVFVH
jgi:Amidase